MVMFSVINVFLFIFFIFPQPIFLQVLKNVNGTMIFFFLTSVNITSIIPVSTFIYTSAIIYTTTASVAATITIYMMLIMLTTM